MGKWQAVLVLVVMAAWSDEARAFYVESGKEADSRIRAECHYPGQPDVGPGTDQRTRE